jgi:flavin-dependent dehydrogenase
MTVGPGWYCGVAPVPGGRVNVGIVLGAARLRREVAGGGRPADLVDRVVAQLPGPVDAWRSAPRTDQVQVASPLAHRPRRLAGRGWLLVGDAAGFIDPLSGEGLSRALTSAARAARAILDASDHGGPPDLAGYHRWMRARYRGKDAVSWLLQGFLARPEVAGYALTRMAHRPPLAQTFNDVLTDRAPASRALDPRFLARVLTP